MRFHVLGLPFTQTSRRWCACAYTSKILNFCRLMTARGHQVIHYGAENSEIVGQYVDIISADEQHHFFGDFDKQRLPSPSFDSAHPAWQLFNERAAVAIAANAQPHDFVCHIAGLASKPVADILTNAAVLNIEYGIGYTGSFAAFRAFESYSLMHATWTREGGIDPDGKNYDVVIPNYYDTAEFPAGDGGGDYLAFIGRMTRRKGLEIAVEVANALDMKLVVAGQGASITRTDGDQSTLTLNEGPSYTGKIDYLGHVNPAQKAVFLGQARALLVPTIYLEPFGGVNVESQLCGTPVISSDWAGFIDTVEHGQTGYRCRTLEHYVWAAKNAWRLNREYIRERARAKYSLEKAGEMYEEWFSMLLKLWQPGKGWYDLSGLDTRTDLNWLE